MSSKIIFVGLLFVIAVGVGCVPKAESKLNLKYEQFALNYFADSLLANPNMFMKESDEIFLLPSDFDSTWLNSGLFSNCNLPIDSLVRILSKPYFDEYAVKDMDDQVEGLRETAQGYLKDYKAKEKSGLQVVVISIPEKINKNSSIENVSCSWSLEIKHHLRSGDEVAVELSFAKGETHLNLLVFMDKMGNVLGWNFRPKTYPEV